MKPVYLQRAQLCSALGEDLQAAATACRQGRLPQPEWFELHERNERRPYLAVAGASLALRQRLHQLVAASSDGALDDCLLILASTTLDIVAIEARVKAGEATGNPMAPALDALAEELRQEWGFAGAFTLNTACTSAANALLYGVRLVARNHYRRALVLAFETPSEVTRQGFGVLELTSPSAAYRPFHAERDGLILGEAYASVMLTREPGPEPLAKLLGGFSACDTSSLTNTAEDGSHIDWVMRRALHSARTTTAKIALVKLHGTATAANDQAESNGMRRTFAHALPPLCVLKPYLGHTLGACGLSETLLLLESLRQGGLPGCDYAEQALLPLAAGPQSVSAGSLLLANYFGFGGNNASLVLQGIPA
ncbi:beta-ketoacyl synthase N-terminal-like domain-containing protein [Stutzerimonas nitrititolerans]|uniref:beta-ketoacyl synthase N-terminal-like domain-containing protein n=1 Tax=Stutzerimonas nitrititolerans TaxID=2482751 RepID=UPI0028A73997|nr:beta-ketoacyl synthase N-terminal-like domain-containing protein [Stutzerimonas nitrititolerans]